MPYADIEVKRAHDRAYSKTHRSQMNVNGRRYYAAHREKEIARTRRRQEADPEKWTHYRRHWYRRVGYFKQLEKSVNAQIVAFKQMPVPMVKP